MDGVVSLVELEGLIASRTFTISRSKRFSAHLSMESISETATLSVSGLKSERLPSI